MDVGIAVADAAQVALEMAKIHRIETYLEKNSVSECDW